MLDKKVVGREIPQKHKLFLMVGKEIGGPSF